MSRVLVVLGMHRSGTSLLAAMLECLGVDYGDQLIGPRSDNPKGFWEDAEAISLNDSMYMALDGFSSSLGFDEQKLSSMPECAGFQARIAALLSHRLKRCAIYGIKDPRMSRLMRVWAPVLEKVSDQVDYLIPLRNPLSVAASLAARDGFSIRKGLLLWYEHMYRILEFSQGRRAMVVDYDDFLDSPQAILKGIASEFKLSFDQTHFDSFSKDVMDVGLRHNSFESADLDKHPDAFPALRRLYAVLCDWAAGVEIESEEFRRRMSQIDADFNSLWTLLKHCGEQDVDLWKSWQERCSERERWGDREGELIGWVHQLEADSRTLRKCIGSLESSRENLSQEWLLERDWFGVEIAGLGEMLKERSSALEWSQSEVENLTAVLEERNSALRWYQSEVETLNMMLQRGSASRRGRLLNVLKGLCYLLLLDWTSAREKFCQAGGKL